MSGKSQFNRFVLVYDSIPQIKRTVIMSYEMTIGKLFFIFIFWET